MRKYSSGCRRDVTTFAMALEMMAMVMLVVVVMPPVVFNVVEEPTLCRRTTSARRVGTPSQWGRCSGSCRATATSHFSMYTFTRAAS